MNWSLNWLKSPQFPNLSLESAVSVPENSHEQAPESTNLVISSFSVDYQPQNITASPSLPSPILTNLWPHNSVLLTAGIQNAHPLDIAFSSIITTLPISPLYDPSATLSSDPTALLSAACKSHCPPDLKPTLAQILFAHHAYLDLVPFPVFRERAITLAATSPRFFDLNELKGDIIRDGLRYCSSMGGGQPWDRRSWIVAPWFLKKWKLLMVGAEGSFYR